MSTLQQLETMIFEFNLLSLPPQREQKLFEIFDYLKAIQTDSERINQLEALIKYHWSPNFGQSILKVENLALQLRETLDFNEMCTFANRD